MTTIVTLETKIELGVRRPFEVEAFVELDRAVVKSYATNSPRHGMIVLTSLYVGPEDLLDGQERDALLVSPAGIEARVRYGTRVALYGYHTGLVMPGLQVAPGDEFGVFTFRVELFG